MLKTAGEPAMVGTPTTEGALTQVEIPGTEGMSTTTGSQQQQNITQQHTVSVLKTAGEPAIAGTPTTEEACTNKGGNTRNQRDVNNSRKSSSFLQDV